MSLDLQGHRLSKLEDMLAEVKENVAELTKSMAAIRESLAAYRAVTKFAVALASAVGAMAALLIDWLK